MQRTTPTFQPVGPTSPPDTPRDTSPTQIFARMAQVNTNFNTDPRSCVGPATARRMSHNSHIKPTGNGHHFTFSRPDQLSPRSSSSSEACHSGSEASSAVPGVDTAPPNCPIPSIERDQQSPVEFPPVGSFYESYHIPTQHASDATRPLRVVAYTEVNFEVEEMASNYSDDEELLVMRPSAIEYPQSERSRSRSRERQQKFMNSFAGMGFHETAIQDDSEDDASVDEMSHRRILQGLREARRRRRMTSGSIGKRTISESIGSDSDNEDVTSFLGADEVGSSARRLRRKYERHSFIFHDPPPPRIDEMTEEEDDDLPEVEIFAKELPYWTTMEMDDP